MVQRKNLKKHFLFLNFFSLCMSADSPLIAREEIGCRQSRDATISTLPSIQPKPNQRYSRKTVCCQKKTRFAAKLCFFKFFSPPLDSQGPRECSASTIQNIAYSSRRKGRSTTREFHLNYLNQNQVNHFQTRVVCFACINIFNKKKIF